MLDLWYLHANYYNIVLIVHKKFNQSTRDEPNDYLIDSE